MTTPTVREIDLLCSDGVRIAGQSWKAAEGPTSHHGYRQNILCLHGWLDNCRSFYHLAPSLVEQVNNPQINLVALDVPGHGKSSHKSIDGAACVLSESVYYVAEAVKELGWWDISRKNSKENSDGNQQFILLGHSMGAAISCLYAAAFPEQIEKLVLIDGAGPLARPPEDLAKHVRSHIQKRIDETPTLQKLNTSRAIYPNLDTAVKLRQATAKKSPGDQSLSEMAAREMVMRGSKMVADGRQFRHDPRLRWPSIQYVTEEQVEALYKDIQCPTCLLLAENGWPLPEEKVQRVLDLLKPKVFKRLPGSHHLHADPDTADRVVEEISKFLTDESNVEVPDSTEPSTENGVPLANKL